MMQLLNLSVFQQFDLLHYLVFVVFVLGVGLAYLSDADEPTATKVDRARTEKDGKKNENRHGLVSTVVGTKWAEAVLSVFRFPFLVAIAGYVAKIARTLTLVKAHLSAKKAATSKRHYFYMMVKKALGLQIQPNETIIDSYMSCREFMGEKWPFMWQVEDVKQDAIVCEGLRCVPFSSYSYLDLMRCQDVQNAALDAAREWSTGNHGPRMLGGNTRILRDLEKTVARFFGRDDSLLCATGYLACMSAVAAVSTSTTVMFADSRVHASIRSGLTIGEGKTILFPHNDFVAAKKLVAKHRKSFNDAWVVIESVYSMDGDIGHLPSAVALCKEFDMKLVIDEAHGLGVLGKTGRGAEEYFNMRGAATLIMGTFSKSIAGIGGYITGPEKIIKYMDFHATGNVFSAPLTAYSAGGAIKAFEMIDRENWRVTKAQNNSQLLRKYLETGLGEWPADYPEENKYTLEGDPSTTVIPVIFRDDMARLMDVATEMKRRGFMLSAVAYPACPLRSPRFRVTATAAQSEESIEQFVRTLVQVTVATPPAKLL